LLKFTKRLAALAGVTILGSLGLTACGGGAHTLALVGSDTTFDVMNAVSNEFNDSSTNTAANVPPVLGSGGSFTVPADKRCGEQTYNSGNPPPNGSSAGVSALAADSNGCVDIARSSRDKRDTDPSNLEFYAFARDAVTWARFSGACPGGDAAPQGCAPTNLTQDQLKGIYLCTEPGGVPAITNWAQVGGDNEPIKRYLAQPGSGTYAFFAGTILGLSTSQQNVLDDSACATGSKPIRVQENDGTKVGDKARGIVNYSFGQWTAQKNGVVPNIRGGAQLAQINGVAPNPTNIANASFLGVRYVNNVVKTGSPSYGPAIDFVGVDSGGNGFLCTNDATKNSIVTTYGFVLNPFAPAGPGLPNSRCRKNPTPL
jgi:ABC-type phosphate transport system substrate-binding protein